MNALNPLTSPELVYLRVLLRSRIERARTAPSRGASAIEWVVITAIVLGLAAGIFLVIKNVVTTKQNEITKFGNQTNQ